MNCTVSRGRARSRSSSPPATNCIMRQSCCKIFYSDDDVVERSAESGPEQALPQTGSAEQAIFGLVVADRECLAWLEDHRDDLSGSI